MRLFLVGASGHGKVVADIVRLAGSDELAGFLDDDPAKAGGRSLGLPIFLRADAMRSLGPGAGAGAIVTIGTNSVRMALAGELLAAGLTLRSAVHPAAVVAADVALGPGTVVMAGAVLNPGTSVGANVIVNTGATVDHDCILEDGVHVSPGAHLAGGVRVGRGAHVGIGAVVIPGIRIGSRSVVGAGAAVIREVPDGATVAGTPARALARGGREARDERP